MTNVRPMATVTRVDLVIGVDAGGTSTRCVVADRTGRPLGLGAAAGFNQRSSGGDPVARLEQALASALGGLDPAAVRAGVLGVAGAGAAGQALVERQADEAWRRLELGGDPVVVPDLLAAYAAGAAEPAGSVLVAGTGAGAAAVEDRRVVRQADGAGWLVGDVGSAVWLAREALVAVVASLDGRGPTTGLAEPMLERLLGRPGPHGVQDVIGGVYDVPPASLGELAPVVTAVAAAGDQVARDVAARGTAGLLASLDAVRPAGRGPVVLAGALLTRPGPVLAGVSAGLADRGVADPRPAERPTAGAAWLALVSLGVTDEAVHARLTRPDDPSSPTAATPRR
jgi:N-acetylglucosamine kinase-like BadF-type ATPase